MLSGTATAPATYEYRLFATDVDGDQATLPFTIEVEPGIESRDLALVLAGIGRTLASDAVEILGSRAGPTPSRLHVTLGGQVLRLTDPAGSAPAASPVASGTPSPLDSAPSPSRERAGVRGLTLPRPPPPPAPAPGSASRASPSAWPAPSASPLTPPPCLPLPREQAKVREARYQVPNVSWTAPRPTPAAPPPPRGARP